jgi:hypothetical protein
VSKLKVKPFNLNHLSFSPPPFRTSYHTRSRSRSVSRNRKENLKVELFPVCEPHCLGTSLEEVVMQGKIEGQNHHSCFFMVPSRTFMPRPPEAAEAMPENRTLSVLSFSIQYERWDVGWIILKIISPSNTRPSHR